MPKPGSTVSCPSRCPAATSPGRGSSSSRTARSWCRRATATPTSRSTGRSLLSDTLCRPGSVSKLFTWTAVMQQVEQGKLDLDADVNQYLDFKIPARDGKPVTLRNIMTHTSGFEEHVKGLMSTEEDPVPTLEAVL